MENSKCGELIQSLRKQRGMTQRDLASLLNVSDRAVSKWERGESYPEVTTLVKISDILGVSTDELLKGQVTDNSAEVYKDYNLKRFQNKALIGLLCISVSIFGILQSSTYGEFGGIVNLALMGLTITGGAVYFIARRNIDYRFNIIDLNIIFYAVVVIGIYTVMHAGEIWISYDTPEIYTHMVIVFEYYFPYRIPVMIALLGVGIFSFYKVLILTYSNKSIELRKNIIISLLVNFIGALGLIIIAIIVFKSSNEYTYKLVKLTDKVLLYGVIIYISLILGYVLYTTYKRFKVIGYKSLLGGGIVLAQGIALGLSVYFGFHRAYPKGGNILGVIDPKYFIIIVLLSIIALNLELVYINSTKKIS
ncbi:MAG: helix-turn-helix transcriptional regulator [Clostridium sp.]